MSTSAGTQSSDAHLPTEDEIVHANYDVARQAYELIPTQKRWYDIRDGHFGLLYHPGEHFEEAAHVQSQFLRANLDA